MISEQNETECARILRETFTLKSQIDRPVKIRTARSLIMESDFLHEIVVSKAVRTIFESLRAALPANAYLIDDRFNGGVLFPAFGIGVFPWVKDSYHFMFGSDDWPPVEPGGMFPALNINFRKDPITWKYICELVPIEFK